MTHYLPLLLIALLIAACSSTDPEEEPMLPEEVVIGTWQRIINQTEATLSIRDDGRYTVSYNTLTVEGEHQINSNGHLVVQDAGCGTFIGVYSMTFTDGERTLIFGMVDDNCVIRGERWRGGWSRVGQ